MALTVPSRRTYAWIAALLMAFTIYISVLPFRLQLVPAGEALARFVEALSGWPRRLPRANFLANLLLFVPIGFSLAGARLADRPDRSWVRTALRAMVLSLLVSLMAEFAQVFAPRRVVSAADVAAQSLGCLLGVVVWPVLGPGLTAWVRESRAYRHDRIERALLGYAVLWALANLAPFDVTLDVEELARRVRDGSVSVLPALPRRSVRVWWDLTVTLASGLPVGLAALLVGPDRSGHRRGALAAVALSGSLVLAVEVAQVFLRSHAATAMDFGMGWLGASVGVWAGTRWRPLDARSSGVSSRRPWWRWPAVATAVLLAAGYHWQPFDFALDESLVRQKIGSISLVPFAGYTVGNDLAALNNFISKVGVAVPLGASAAWVAPTRLPRRLALVLWVAVATVVFGAIEIGQFFLPARVPDPTDVAVGVAASAVGLTTAMWLRRVEP